MTINDHEELGYITLKQASERFGYAPDYIGQLIRKGKIEGKQVYANVAWMTTERSMEEYIAGTIPEKHASGGRESFFYRGMEKLFSERSLPVLLWVMRAVMVILVLIGLLVFYFLSLAIDDRLTEHAQNSFELRMRAEALVKASVIIPHNPVAYGE